MTQPVTTTENDAIIQRLATVCEAEVAPYALQVDRERRFPTEAIGALRRNGFLALAVEKKYGGLGAGFGGDYLLMYRAAEEVAKWCTSTAQILMVQAVTTSQIAAMGNEEQKRRFLGAVVRDGELWGSWASELNASLLTPETTARAVAGGYVINGQKFFSTNSLGASRFLLWAVMEGGNFLTDLLIVALDAKAPGVEIVDDWDGMGQRGTASGTSKFTSVFVPQTDVLGDKPNAFYSAPGAFGPTFQLGFAACYLGTAEGAYADACRYIKNRVGRMPGQQKLSEDPYVQLHIADLETRLTAGRLLVYDAARRLQAVATDPGRRVDAALAVYKAKIFTTETALAVTNDVFNLCGTSATLAGNKFEMFWRNIRTLTLHDPVDRRREAVGKAVLGIAEPPVAAL